MEKSARERAYDFVKEEIAAGRLALGQFVTETEIASQIGVSRTPVREALHLLEQSGFVQIVPKKGVYIPHMSPQEIEDVWEARRLVESYSVRRILPFIDESFLATLDQYLEDQAVDAEAGDAEGFISHDRLFHKELVHTAGNAIITGFYESLRDRQLRMGVQAVLVTPGRFDAVRMEHEAIVDALREGSEEAAVDAVIEHLDATRRATLPWRVETTA